MDKLISYNSIVQVCKVLRLATLTLEIIPSFAVVQIFRINTMQDIREKKIVDLELSLDECINTKR